MIGALRRTVVCDWCFNSLRGSHLQSQVMVLVSWKFRSPGEQFDWSIDRVTIGKYVMWLAVKTCVEIAYANRWVEQSFVRCRKRLITSSRTLQMITQQETVKHYLCSFYNSSICITYLRTHLQSQLHHTFTNGYSIYWLIKSLTRVFEFSTDYSKTITWLWTWLPHRLSKHQLQTTVLLRTPIAQMIFFDQVTTHC